MKLVKESSLSHGGGRVMAFCPWDTQLSVSKASAMAGYVQTANKHGTID
jgi:hypothetical protein